MGWTPLALLLTVAAAGSQIPAFDNVQFRLRPGQQVWVTSREGLETRGVVGLVTGTSLTLRTAGGDSTFAAADIVRIEKPDPVLNGAVEGGTLGAVFILLPYLAVTDCRPHCARDIAGITAVWGGIGALIGTGVDAARKNRTVVYGSKPIDVQKLGLPGISRRTAPVATLGGLPARLRAGQSLEVTDSSGRAVRGQFAGVSVASINLAVAGRIEQIDALKVRTVSAIGNYQSAGVGLGLLGGVLAGALCHHERYDYSATSAACQWGAMATGTIAGAVVGHHTVRRVPLYQAQTSTSLSLVPFVGRRAGVVFTLRY